MPYENKDLASDSSTMEKKGGYPSGDKDVPPSPAPTGEAPGAQHKPQPQPTGSEE